MRKNKKNRIARGIVFFLIILLFALIPQNIMGEQAVLAILDTEATDQPQTVAVQRDGLKCDVISYVYTTERKFSITISGMADGQTMSAILDKLDKYNMKALFLLPGMRVAEEPEIAKEILDRGHAIGNNTLHDTNLTSLSSYEEVYNEIEKTNEVIERETGVVPAYFSNRSGTYNNDVLEAADDCGMDMVTYTINLQEWGKQTADEVKAYLLNKLTMGGVVALSTDNMQTALDSIDLIANAADTIGYSVVPLDELLSGSYERKPLNQIPGYDAAKLNLDYEDAPYNLVYNGVSSSKMVTLTFDDWGSDWAVTRILDVLDEYNVKATFFLRANGVEENPNLAKAIADEGHDIGNHTYDHPVITELTPIQLQQEIIDCHRVLTEAIQKQPTLIFRPPSGEINDTVLKAVAACGYEYTSMYDLDPKDWNTENTKDDIVESVKANIAGGDIILLHSEVKFATYEALPEIIEYLQGEGYQIVPLSEMISSGNANILHGVPEHTPGT